MCFTSMDHVEKEELAYYWSNFPLINPLLMLMTCFCVCLNEYDSGLYICRNVL